MLSGNNKWFLSQHKVSTYHNFGCMYPASTQQWYRLLLGLQVQYKVPQEVDVAEAAIFLKVVLRHEVHEFFPFKVYTVLGQDFCGTKTNNFLCPWHCQFFFFICVLWPVKIISHILSRVKEKTNWALASRTWLVSHVTQAGLEHKALRWRAIKSAKDYHP